MTVAISTEVARLAQEAVQDGTLSNVYQVCAIARGARGCEWDCIQEKLVFIRARDPERFARLTQEVNPFGNALSPEDAYGKIAQQVMYLACEYRADELEAAHRLPSDFKQRFMLCDRPSRLCPAARVPSLAAIFYSYLEIYPFLTFLVASFLLRESRLLFVSVPLTGKKKDQAENFYDKLLGTLIRKKLPFMIGGTYAFMHYTGIERDTGDIDIKIPYEDYPAILKELSDAGYKTELAEIELNWLAKVTDEDGFYTDLIYAERNGLYKVERSWFDRSTEGTVLGHKVKVEPVEEIIRSKCYVRNRHRDDSGDVVHLILQQGKNVDWKIVMQKMEPHWELLLSVIVLFLFIYPSERPVIPKWVVENLVGKLEDRISRPPTKNKITRGLLLSNDYQVGVANWGFKPITELK